MSYVKLVSALTISLIIILGLSQSVNSYQSSFVFTNEDNEISNLSIYSGSYLLVDAFATWCEACKTEMKHLIELYEAVGDQIQMFSLSVDPEDTIKMIIEFKNEFGAPWEFGLDHESQFKVTYPVIEYPTHYFFDGEGNVLLSWTGITSVSKFMNDLDDYIDVPEGYDKSDDLDIYVDEILTNPLFLISAGIMVILIIWNLMRKKAITAS